MPRNNERLPSDEHDVVVGDALDALLELTRDQAARIAADRCPVRWVRPADRAGVLEVLCLGRFDLVNPDRPDLPWPAVMFVFSRPAEGLHPAVCCKAALYWAPEGGWEVSADEPVETATGRRLLIDWSQYRGDRDGPAGLVNGDKIEDVKPSRTASSPDTSRPETARKPAAPPAAARPSASPLPAAPRSSELLRLKLEIAARVLRLLEE